MQRTRRLLASISLPGITLLLGATTVLLQENVHDPRHVLLTLIALWGVLSLPVGLLVGHLAIGEDRK